MSATQDPLAATGSTTPPKAVPTSIPTPSKIHGRLPRGLKPLGYRDYRLFWIASVVSNTGTWMYLTALGWLVETSTDSPFLVSLLVMVGIVPLLLFSPLGGTLADRMPRVRLMILTVLMQTVVAAALTVAVIADAAPYWVLLVFSLLNGCAASLGAPVQQAIIPELVAAPDLRNAVVMNSSQWNISRAVGPLLAGFIITIASESVVFVVNTVSFVLMILVLSLMTEYPAPNPAPATRGEGEGTGTAAPARPSQIAAFVQAVSYARRKKGIITLLVSASILSVVLSPLSWLVPVIARDVFEVEAGGFGWLAGSFGIGSICGGIVLLSVGASVSSVRLVLVGYGGLATCVALLAGSPTLIIGIFSTGLCGFFFVFVSSSLMTQLQVASGDEYRGRMMSLWMMIFGAFVPLAVVAHGSIAEYVSMRWVLLGDSVCLVIYLGSVWLRRALGRTDGL